MLRFTRQENHCDFPQLIRPGQLPLSVRDGDLLIRIDTATLKNGVTPFFELIRE